MIRKDSLLFFKTNEQGFVLVTALVFLVILTLLGVNMINTSVTEVQIAANDKIHKQTFTLADGGTEIGSNLLEENIACPNGFPGPAPLQIGSVEVTADLLSGADLNFWINEIDPATLTPPVAYPSDTMRHLRIPNNDALPHTNLHFFGNTSLSTGNAVQMIAGYEGTGFSSASGGGQLVTNIDSQHLGETNSVSVIKVHWRHVVGHEGTCNY